MHAVSPRGLVILTLLTAGAAAIWYQTRPRPIEVQLAQATPGVVERIVANTRAGTVKACRRARLAPGVGGQISALKVREGQRVKAGDLLLALWNDDLIAQVSLAEREADASRSKAEAACLHAAHAQREARRLSALRARGVASEDEVDKATTEASALQADCAAAQASAKVQQARIGVAKANLEKTRLTAPFGGVVAEVTGELHEYVTPSPPGIPTPPAVDLIDDSCFYVAAPIDEVDASKIQVGQRARVTLDAFGEQVFAGETRRIAPYILDLEKQARTVEVEVEFVNGEEKRVLMAGYSADVEIITEHRESVLRIPTEAVMEGTRVYRYVAAQKTLELVNVETGLSNWEWTEVQTGLDGGDRVVTSLSQEGLADGVVAVPAATASLR
jgi:HlyD family secretion protein